MLGCQAPGLENRGREGGPPKVVCIRPRLSHTKALVYPCHSQILGGDLQALSDALRQAEQAEQLRNTFENQTS